VSAGKADAAITNRFYGMVHAKKFKLEDTAIIFNPTKLFFAFTKPGDAALMKAVDDSILQMKEDPESKYYQALKRWTSEKFEFTLPVWMKVFGLVAGTALLMSLVGVVVLRSQVNKRTHQLRKINREMEGRIEQRTAELATAMEKAQVADRLKSAFLATMSHELRTPLNSIIGFTGILLQKLAGPLNEEQEKQMRMVQTSARHLLDLINDVLDISKIEAGQLDLSYGTFELRGSIQKTVDLVSPLAEKKGLDIELELAQDLGLVKSDQRRLEQIILNLLNNALKFTEQGHVRIACRSDDDHYMLSVSDTGMGIQPEELSGLFKPFHQIDTGLSRKHEGTGLGLSICKKLMDLMGGTIDVQSKWGQGSNFFIRFPKGVSQEDSS
jgi:signal transduction histidine kinase